MSRFVVSVFALLLVVAAVEATLGVDVSSLWPQSSWECMSQNGFSFAIIRCFRSSNSVDPNCAESVARAWAGGMKHVDLYMFPCAKCSDIADQVHRLDEHIRSNNITYGQVWIDIEGAGEYWPTDKEKNRKIFDTLCSTATEVFGTRFAGLYVSHRSWVNILGADYKEWGNLKVWYANWDHKPGFGNWQPYGAFTTPTIHQYWGNYKEKCKMNVDLNYCE